MQLFIDVVDAKLLELVLFEIFEPEDIQETNRLGIRLEVRISDLDRLNGLVHLEHQPVEQIIVELLRKGISVVLAICQSLRFPNCFSRHHVYRLKQDFTKVLCICIAQ